MKVRRRNVTVGARNAVIVSVATVVAAYALAAVPVGFPGRVDATRPSDTISWPGATAGHDDVEACMFVQAHRGFSESFPENTMLAITKALEAGADRIETDLAVTRDDVIVLMHDRSLDRTTSGRGRVQSFTFEQISELDAGSWKGPQFAGERVPTLAEALNAVAGAAVLNLELKTGGSTTSVNERIYDGMIDLVREHDAFGWVIVSSFDALALQAVREREPRLRLLLLDYDPPSTNDKLSLAIDFGFWAWSPNSTYISAERVARAKEAGLNVHVGASPTANLRELAEWGVDGVSNNDPSILVGALERQGLRVAGESCAERAGLEGG